VSTSVLLLVAAAGLQKPLGSDELIKALHAGFVGQKCQGFGVTGRVKRYGVVFKPRRRPDGASRFRINLEIAQI